MKKHVFGLVIFSFIVFAAAFIYGIFSFSEIVDADVPQYVPAERTHCDFKREVNQSLSDSSIITQAVFNTKTKKLSWELSPVRMTEFPVLHLFIKDEKGVRILQSVYTVKYFMNGDATKFSNQYSEIGKLSSKTTLYLIADTSASAARDETERNDNAVFDINTAFPVTIDYGK